MADLPTGIPMYTHDLKQEADRLGNPKLPALPGARTHRAIDDALECQYRRRWLADRFRNPPMKRAHLSQPSPPTAAQRAEAMAKVKRVAPQFRWAVARQDAPLIQKITNDLNRNSSRPWPSCSPKRSATAND